MKIKNNWGFWIALSYSLFVILAVIFVVWTFGLNNDLVEKDYYDKGLTYDKQINKIKKTRLLIEQLEIIKSDSTVELIFPRSFIEKKISGEILFYRPSNSKMDFKIPVSVDSINRQNISISGLFKGWWQIKVNWAVNGNEYYNENDLIIGY